METWYVTGSDSRSYLHVRALLRSFAQHSPRATLRVCDFGLSPEQRAELQAERVLVKRPGPVPVGCAWAQAFSYMHLYRPGARTLVWIDPASLVVGPLAQQVDALLRSWGGSPRVAMAHDPHTPTFGEVLSPAELGAFGVDADHPLFGINLVISRCPAVWRTLADLAPRLMPVGRTHQIWFNALLAALRVPVQSLDGTGLYRSGEETRTLVASGARVVDGDRSILLVHPDGVPPEQRVRDGLVQCWRPLPHPRLAALQEQALLEPQRQGEALQVTA